MRNKTARRAATLARALATLPPTPAARRATMLHKAAAAGPCVCGSPGPCGACGCFGGLSTGATLHLWRLCGMALARAAQGQPGWVAAALHKAARTYDMFAA